MSSAGKDDTGETDAGEAILEQTPEEADHSPLDIPFTPASARDNQLRYARTLIEPYDVAVLRVELLRAQMGVPLCRLPQYSRLRQEAASCVYDYDDGIRLIVVPELWPGEVDCKSVVRVSGYGYDHLAATAAVESGGTWEPDIAFVAETALRFSRLTGVSADRLLFTGMSLLGLPCWIYECDEETIQ